MKESPNPSVRVVGVLLTFALFLSIPAKSETLVSDSSNVKSRIAFRTNTIDWVLTIPNVAVDYDIVNTPYEKISVGLSAKYNWNSRHNYIPDYVFNLFDLRTDLRYYWRQQPFITDDDGNQWQKSWIKSRPKIWERWITRLRLFRTVENPRDWLSFYAGPYLSYTSYSFKFSEIGHQGDAFGLGATMGVAVPLYGYNNGSALDLELGTSIGWHLTTYHKYMSDVESNCYSSVGKALKFIWYPIISDLRVALVYRFNSIQNQHTEIDENLHIRHRGMYERDTIYNEIISYNNSISDLKQKVDSENKKIRESLKLLSPADSLYYPTLLNPILLMRTIPDKFVKDDTDTVPHYAEVNTLADIRDEKLLRVRKEIDSIPGITNASIDNIFVAQYKFIKDDPDAKNINRALLVKNIYVALNGDIKATNNQYTKGGIAVTDAHSERILRHNLNSAYEDVNYSIAVSRSNLSKNDRIKWENEFKRMGMTKMQERIQQAASLADSTKTTTVSIPTDSTSQAIPDSVGITQAVASDSILQVSPADSTLQTVPADSTLQAVPADSIQQSQPASIGNVEQEEGDHASVIGIPHPEIPFAPTVLQQASSVFTKPEEQLYE